MPSWLAWLQRLFPPSTVPPAVHPVNPVPPVVPPLAPGKIPEALLDAHNAVRTSHGLPPLRWDWRLQSDAARHSQYMARVGKLGHDDVGDGDPWERIKATGYVFTVAAENVAWNQRTVAEVMAAWVGSQGHYENIMNPAVLDFGGDVAVAPGGSYYWATVFANGPHNV